MLIILNMEGCAFMKITNFNLLNLIRTLNFYADKKLPQKISYAITRNIILLQKDCAYYEKSLNKLFSDYDHYIVKDENGNIMKNDRGVPITEDKVSDEFNEELENLLNIELEIVLYNIPENVFDYEDNGERYDTLSATDIMNLQAILCKHEGDDNNVVSD